MDPSREALLSLLELQKIDTAIDRIEARLSHLPEQAALDALEARLADLDVQIAERKQALDEVSVRQRRLDNEVDSVGQKIAGESNRLYSGMVKNAKELSDISREIEALKRRKGILEDNDLEVMEERDGIEAEHQALLDERTAVLEEIAQARILRDHASEGLGVQLSAAQAERAVWPPRIESELLGLYDTIRAHKSGIGAAAMVDGVCQGCHMRLPAMEAERVRSASGLTRCDECRRILVVL
ncbi:MAG TPA: C4-type zinc ribbon domain-containing protein [Actinomycetota bacterium]|nr:C4-type zinc ribbon domain-containing protein [Actinomycetota bacterium]